MEQDDLAIDGGDFLVGTSDPQHVYHILLNSQGSYKQYPLTGVGKPRIINGTFDGALRREIQLQLESDGIRLTSVVLDERTGINVEFESAA